MVRLRRLYPPTDFKVAIGARVHSVSYGFIETATQESVMKELDRLRRLGVQIFNIHLNYDPFLREDTAKIGILDFTFKTVKNWGKTVVISDSAAESYHGKGIPWRQFEVLWSKRVGDIAERYRPDYYVVIKEPEWYEQSMISDSPSDQQWSSLTGYLSSIVKSMSPSTKTAIAFVVQFTRPGGQDHELMKMVATIPQLDVIGFDSYGGATVFLGGFDRIFVLEESLQYINGKEPMIGETWAYGQVTTPLDPRLLKVPFVAVRQLYSTPLETYWVEVIANVCNQHNIPSLIYFNASERMHRPSINTSLRHVIRLYQE